MKLHKKDYLSAEVGLTKMPSLYYFLFSLIYLCFLVFWIFFKNQRTRHTMHLLMGVYLVITSAHLMNDAAERHFYVKVPNHSWDGLFYLFQLFRSVLFFWIIALIGSGLCFWKPVLYGREQFILMDMSIFQVLGNIASIAAGDLTNDYSDHSKASVLISDYTCCVLMFIPMFYSILSLRDEVRETEGNNANATSNLEKLCLFMKVAAGYVFFTRIVIVVVLGPVVVDKWSWVIDASTETTNLVFCMVMFYMYRPLENNVVVGDEELGL